MYAKELREQLARLANQMRGIVDQAKTVNRGLTTEEAESFDRMEKDYSALEASIARAEKLDHIETSLKTIDPQMASLGGSSAPIPAAAPKTDLHAAAFNKYVRFGMEGLDTHERNLMAGKQAAIQNTMSTTTGSQGGYLVPQGFSQQLEEAQLWFGGIEESGVEQFTTDTGNSLPWPTDNDTSNTGEIVGQNTPVTAQDMAFSQVVFGSYIFSSKLVKVPLALIQDSYFDVNAYIAKKLGTRLGRIKNNKFTVGTGGGTEPTGIVSAAVTAANIYQPGAGNSTTVSADSLVELEHAVDPNYRNNPTSQFMFADSTLKAIKKLKDGQNRPLWLPMSTGSASDNLAPPTILGHRYIINNDVPVMAASATSILFGDLSKYKVRNVAGGTSLLRLVERYAEYLQVGFIAFTRADGNLLDAGTHPIAIYKNSAT